MAPKPQPVPTAAGAYLLDKGCLVLEARTEPAEPSAPEVIDGPDSQAASDGEAGDDLRDERSTDGD